MASETEPESWLPCSEDLIRRAASEADDTQLCLLNGVSSTTGTAK